MDKLRAMKKDNDGSCRTMDQLENMFITDMEDPWEIAERETLFNNHPEKSQGLNSAIKAANEEEATFDILKGIRLLNLRIKKSGLQEILNCAHWRDYTGTMDNPTLPTMVSFPKWKPGGKK